MRRERLIPLIAQERVARRPPHEKLKELPGLWGWDEDVPGWTRLPWSVRLEMLERPNGPPWLWRSTYDAFFQVLEEDALAIVRSEALLEEAHALGLKVDAVEGAPAPAEPCPCCGYRTLEWRGDHDTCPVCAWEDEREEDAFDDGPEALARYSGANHATREEARRVFEERRAADLASGEPARMALYSRYLRG
jgi:hypothetical protein